MARLQFALMVWLALLPPNIAAQTQGSATVSGIVTDAVTHLPVWGANVNVGGSGMGTDESGSYSISVKPGAFRLRVARGGYLANIAEIEIHDGDLLRRDLEIRPAPRIAGTITDADTGQPIRGCLVFAMRRIMALGQSWYTSCLLYTSDAADE